MLWKMWINYGDIPLVVEADTLDEAMRAARKIHPDYCTAQPMEDLEAAEFMEGMHRVEGGADRPVRMGVVGQGQRVRRHPQALSEACVYLV